MDRAWRSYAQKVLAMVFKDVGPASLEYLHALIDTMDENGIMRSDGSIAKALGKPVSVVSTYRSRLKAHGILESPRRGALAFRIPYVPRYLSERMDLGEDELAQGADEMYPMT